MRKTDSERRKQGICLDCGNNPISFERSVRYCNSCLDLRKNYYYTHKDSVVEQRTTSNFSGYHRDWQRKNKEKVYKYSVNYRTNNPGKYAKRKDSRKSMIGSFTKNEWENLCMKFGNRCLWCSRTDVKLTQDHVVPVKQGGTNYISNIQPLCGSCNCKKHTKIIDFRPFGSIIMEWT